MSITVQQKPRARAAIIGESEGGPLSMLFAAAHPERPKRIMVVRRRKMTVRGPWICGFEHAEEPGFGHRAAGTFFDVGERVANLGLGAERCGGIVTLVEIGRVPQGRVKAEVVELVHHRRRIRRLQWLSHFRPAPAF